MGGAESKNSDAGEYFAATFAGNTLLMRRLEASYYANLLSILHKNFPSLPTESVVVQTDELSICDGRYIDIPEELWTEVCPRLRNIRVISRPKKRCEPPSYGDSSEMR
ncbi:hypothetical protein BDZ94DRAFT_1313345 [Collybia nuda]|uniref:Uncharacterized protein n=1 Tax=Collybia nuda TaxID=64659 RepID=A0A9P5XZ85_9AGAR|nr:hypothetical protein BDZ94DRAFT_1313345 [Collybia nuda]